MLKDILQYSLPLGEFLRGEKQDKQIPSTGNYLLLIANAGYHELCEMAEVNGKLDLKVWPLSPRYFSKSNKSHDVISWCLDYVYVELA